MHEDVFEVIDEAGKKISTASWEEIHSQGLLHRGAGVLIFKDESREEVLLQRRSLGITNPGRWQHSAGGHVVAGDTPDECVRKEIQEELFHGHALPPLSLRKICLFRQKDMPGNEEIFHVYETVYPGPFFPNSEEVFGEVVWMKLADVAKDMAADPEKYSPSSCSVVEEYLKHR